jgi:uncharacterized membrane protein YfcA
MWRDTITTVGKNVSGMPWQHALLLFLAAALAGAVNSVAGGGTLLTFPALVYVAHANPALLWAAQAEKIANATSTVALWPGQLSSLWGYRKELGENRMAILRLAVPSFLGGLLGALLLLKTPGATFKGLVPYLILLATLLFIVQEPLARAQRARTEKAAKAAGDAAGPDAADTEPMTPRDWLGVILFQFGVGVYGGYFGAGIGILMLAALGFMGFTNIHRMNGLKNINGLIINAIAAVIFIASRIVDWRVAALMAAGSIVGGYSGAGTARRIGQQNVRRIIILIGFSLALSLLIQR